MSVSLDREVFTAPEERSGRLARAVAAELPEDGAASVLDLGCGSGRPALELARLRPGVRVLGLDLSPGSVEEARRRAATAAEGGRLGFVAADYMAWTAPAPFDLVYTEGVLHLIPGPDAALARRLAGDVAPGGRLVVVMPDDGLFNAVLVGLRRLLRAVRGPRLDALVIGAARRLHPGWPEAMLRERLPYVYLVPERLDGGALRGAFAAAGLELVSDAPWPQDSLGKLRHRVTVYRKSSTA